MKPTLTSLGFSFGLAVAGVAHAAPVDHDTRKAPIQLSISGPIDVKVIGESLANELGREITESGDACAAPCLTVIVSGDDKATIVFAASSGSIRQRTVTLGDDHAQWPVVITLLAGNLVRDEAGDVLALVPAKSPPAHLSVPAPVASPEPPAAPTAAPPKVVAKRHHDDDGDDGDDGDDDEIGNDDRKPAKHVESTSVAIGLFPIASTDLTNTNRSHFLSLNLIVGVNAGATGLALAGITDIEDDVSGLQITGVASISDKVSGFQIGGVTAISDGVSGFQISGVASISDRVSGFQIGGAAAVADDLSGVQIGGAAAVADHVSGVQAAGAVAVADGVNTQIGGAVAVSFGDANLQIGGASAYASRDSDIQIAGAVAVTGRNASIQIGGAVSVSESADVQIAGAVAVTGHVTGMQIAPINIASCVDGLQLGVINIGGCPDGDSFGLINIVPGGRYDLEASIDSNRVGTLLMRHGGRHWHNVYGIGGHPVKQDNGMPNDDVWMYGAGLGPTFRLGGTVLDIEIIGWEVNHGWHHEADLSVLGQLRATLGIPLGFMTLVAGGAINTYVSTDPKSPFILERASTPPDMTSTKVNTTTWPSLFVGVRL